MRALTYTFSKREKLLIVVLIVVLVALLWYQVVYQGTSSQLAQLNNDISDAQTEYQIDSTKLGKMQEMQTAIAKYKANGSSSKTSMPAYDNTSALMARLNKVLGSTQDYTLAFDDLDTGTSGLVKRGVTISFGCGSIAKARAVLARIKSDTFTCSIDSASITQSGDSTTTLGSGTSSATTDNSAVQVTLHVNYYESN